MIKLPPPNYFKDSRNFSCHAVLHTFADTDVSLYLRWDGSRYVVEGWRGDGRLDKDWVRTVDLKTQFDHSRKNNPVLYGKMVDAIRSAFRNVDFELSPEVLTQDGERSPADIAKAEKQYKAMLNSLVNAWGKVPTANEVFGQGGDYPITDAY